MTWKNESQRHSLAKKGVKTKKSSMVITPSYDSVSAKSESGEEFEMLVPTEIKGEREDHVETMEKYQNKENWKMPPTPATVKTEVEARKIADSFTFFLGGAEITPVKGKFKVTSKGYYYYIGA